MGCVLMSKAGTCLFIYIKESQCVSERWAALRVGSGIDRLHALADCLLMRGRFIMLWLMAAIWGYRGTNVRLLCSVMAVKSWFASSSAIVTFNGSSSPLTTDRSCVQWSHMSGALKVWVKCIAMFFSLEFHSSSYIKRRQHRHRVGHES